MLNRSGVAKTTYTAPKQILANVDMQMSVGCIVPQALGVAVGSQKIAKAGTPININLQNLNVAVKKPAAAVTEPAAAKVPMNAVLLHDVDVTAGAANGTALIFGFVNLNRVDTDVATAIATATGSTIGNDGMVTFVKM